MSKIADLIFMLKANADEYSAAFAQAKNSTDKFVTDVKNSTSSSHSMFTSLGTAVSGISVAMTGAIAGFTAAVFNANKEVAQMNSLSQSLGIAPERFQKMTYAAEQLGVPMEEFADMLKDVSERITELATIGTGEAADMFEKMNIDVREFQGLAPDQMFLKMAEALSTLEDRQQRNLFLLQIAGDAGQKLSKITDDGARGFINLANSLEETAGVLSERMIKESIELNKQLKQTQEIVDISLRNSLVSATPIVEAFSQVYADWAQNVALMADKMRDLPLTDGGLASAILRDQDAIKELKEEADGMKQFGYDWSRFATNQDALKEINAEIAALTLRLEENQKRYNEIRGFTAPKSPDAQINAQGGEAVANTGFKKPTVSGTKSELQQQQDQSVAYLRQLDMQYADEMQKLQLASNERLDKIAQIQVSEVDLKRLGYENLAQLRKAYAEKEQADFDQSKTAILERERVANENKARLIQEQQHAEQSRLQQQYSRVEWVAEEFQTEEERIQAHYDRRSQIVAEYYENIGGLTEHGEQLLRQISQRAEDEKRMYQLQNAHLITSNASSMFGSLTIVAEKFKGKSSGIYKAMFAASRAFAIADIVISTAQGAMRAYRENPFPLNIVASGAVVAAGAAQLATIKQTQVQGVFHAGIGYVPEEASYLLNRGESVLAPDDNRDIREAAKRINNDSSSQGGATANINFQISALMPEQATGLILDNKHLLASAVMQAYNEMGLSVA